MSSQRILTGCMGKDDYDLVLELINTSGVARNAIFVGQLILEGAQARRDAMTAKDRSKLPARTRLRLIESETREKIQEQEILNAIVARGIDEQTSDNLQEVIVDLGLDETAAIEFARESPFAEAMAHMNNGTQIGQCQRWLACELTERKTMPRPIIMAMAERKGFSVNLVNRASRKLGITKKKETGGVWHWKAPEINSNNNNNSEHT